MLIVYRTIVYHEIQITLDGNERIVVRKIDAIKQELIPNWVCRCFILCYYDLVEKQFN